MQVRRSAEGAFARSAGEVSHDRVFQQLLAIDPLAEIPRRVLCPFI
jgi:hypothetical protein